MSSTFRVGDRVRVSLGRRGLQGVVTEDRGAIGSHGRHLYQVSVPMDPFEPTTFELPGEEMELVEESEEPGLRLDRARIENYLIHGGLVAVLRSNVSGGRHAPRVWLRPDTMGNVTYTYERERGVIGGEVAPFAALHDDRIFTPKREDVLVFLESFGLDRPAADRIIDSIGTDP
jgi:hypothetical protein